MKKVKQSKELLEEVLFKFSDPDFSLTRRDQMELVSAMIDMTDELEWAYDAIKKSVGLEQVILN